MSQNSVAQTILRFSLDEQAQRRVLKGVSDIEAALAKTSKAVVSVEKVAEGLNAEFAELARARAIDNIAADAIKAAQETNDWAAALERVSTELSQIGASESEIRRVANALADVQTGATRSGSGRSGLENSRQAVGDLSTTFGAAGSVFGGGALNVVGDVAGLVEYLPLAAQGLSALNPAMLGLIAVTGAAAVGIQLFTQAQEAAADALRVRLDAEAEVTRFLANATTEQVRARLDALKIEQQAELSIANQRAAIAANLLAQFNAGTAALSVIGIGGNEYRAALEKLDESNDTLQDLGIQITAYEQALQSGILATNDATAAERELANERNPLADIAEDYKRRAVDLAQYAVQIDGLTEEQRDTEEANLRRQIQILDQYRAAYQEQGNQAAAAELTRQMALLQEKLELVSITANTLADQQAKLAAAGQLLSDTTDQHFTATTKLVEANEDLFETQQKVTEHAAESAKKLQQFETERETARTKIVEDSADAREEIERDNADDLLKLQRQFGRDQFDAVAERDALAAFKNKRKYADDLADQDKATAKALDKQRRAAEKQLQALDDQKRKEYAMLMDSINKESALRATAYQRAYIDAQNASALLNATQAAYSNAVVQAYNVGYLTAQNYIAGLVAGSKYNPGVTEVPGSGKPVAAGMTAYGGSQFENAVGRVVTNMLHDAGAGVRAGGR